jgi:hypothetical protein
MGDGVFRKIRRELGVQAFGANALVLPPGTVERRRAVAASDISIIRRR